MERIKRIINNWWFYFFKLKLFNFVKVVWILFFNKKYRIIPQIVSSSVWTYICYTIDAILISNKYFEPLIWKKIKEILKDIESRHVTFDFVNIWAHMWRYAIEYSNYFRKIYAFEPTPDTYHILKTNIILSERKNIEAFNIALGNKDWVLNFEINEFAESQNKVVEQKNDHSIEVIVKKFDDLDFCKKDIRLFIIDAEWYEQEIIEWMMNYIRKYNDFYIIIELLDQNAFQNIKNKLVWFTHSQIDPTNFIFYKK